MPKIKIHPSWLEVLKEEFSKPYWQELTQFVRAECLQKKVFPPASDIFRAFDLCPFDKVKVVIIGQDPYHGYGQANGLCFAVSEQTALPPSLKNIFKEIHNDLGFYPDQNGDLSRWAKQGVLLLNSVLTVRANQPASHAKRGWEEFTSSAIRVLSQKRQNLVYLLWGKYAQVKGEFIDREKNLVLQSGHPSPFSAHLFFNQHHFSQSNVYLTLQGLEPIDWR